MADREGQAQKEALDKVLEKLALKYQKQGYCPKYSKYLALCDGSMWKELFEFMDNTKDIEWTTQIKKQEK